MHKQKTRDLPFYDDEKSLAIYGDRMIILGAKGRVIHFDDVHYIIFRKIDFTLYINRKNRPYVTIVMKYMGMIDLAMPISGYYALKKYYEKGIKSNGKSEIRITSAVSITALIVLFLLLYIFVFSNWILEYF